MALSTNDAFSVGRGRGRRGGRRRGALAGDGFDKPIFVRADGKAPYEVVAQVMAALSSSGFTKINLITDTGGPSSGTARPPAQPSARAGR